MIRVAILDLYEGLPNQGMRCIREILKTFSENNQIKIIADEFDVRVKLEVPDLTYDIYISTGGPGSPLYNVENKWEPEYFGWLSRIENWNSHKNGLPGKHVFFICHSFQLACRHFSIGSVCPRKSTAFGVFPVHMLENAGADPVFLKLNDPFYAVDSRDYQVIRPNHNQLRQMGATILCIEKERPHVAFERAIMGIRFNKYLVGTQFHPEADAIGMTMYLQNEQKKKTITDNYGIEKWKSMVDQLNDPDKIAFTYNHVIPNFLLHAQKQMHLETP